MLPAGRLGSQASEASLGFWLGCHSTQLPLFNLFALNIMVATVDVPPARLMWTFGDGGGEKEEEEDTAANGRIQPNDAEAWPRRIL